MAKAFLNSTQYNDSNIAEVATLIERTIEEIVIPEGVTVLGACAFRECNKLKKVTLPNGLKRIEAMAFYLIKSLVEIEIPEGVEFIGGSVFSGCSNLAKVTLPESITAIGTTVFNGTAITSFVYPDKVERIDDRIFLSCQKLVSVTAPSACLHVEEYAFGKCPLCVTYDFSKCKAVPKLYDVNAFENINPEAKIFVPEALYADWIEATNWATYAKHITPAYEMNIGVRPEDYSQGLTFVDYEDVLMLLDRGACNDSVIVVPEQYNGRLVRVIGEDLFRNDEYVETVYLPTSVNEMRVGAFENSSIKALYIEGATHISMFWGSSLKQLEYVKFSNRLMYIGGASFVMGNNTVYDFSDFEGEKIPILEWNMDWNTLEPIFGSTLCPGKIIVPFERYEEWKNATNWSYYADKIYPAKRKE